MISNQNIKAVVSYAKSEGIKIDFDDLVYQAENHPNYPTILAITDTLSSYNIENGAIKVSASEIDLLPDRFAAFLSKEMGNSELYFVEKKGNAYFYTIDKKDFEISKSELESRWTGIVLLIEKNENVELTKPNTNHWLRFQSIAVALFFVTVLNILNTDLSTQAFLVFPTAGLLFSVAALKDLFDTKSELLNSFCNMTAFTSCNSIVNSSKWKIFEIVNFSDLSMVFFSFQFIGLFFSILTNNTDSFFTLQKILLVSAVPVIFASLYYQKFVEKKWCPICLVIISIILLELGYLFLFHKVAFTITLWSVFLYGFVFMSVLIAWSALKKLLTNLKELKEFQLKGIRFMRNYDIFKSSLLASEKTNYKSLPSGNLVVGDENTLLKITLVSNLFCGHCKEAHTIIEKILNTHKDKVCVDFRFNFDIEQGNSDWEQAHQKLVQIYYSNGQEAFLKALHDWFENKDESQLIVHEKSTITDLKINDILQEQYLMNQANEIAFTPAIIINQYQYPKMYDRNELVYFINDLVEDDDFQ